MSSCDTRRQAMTHEGERVRQNEGEKNGHAGRCGHPDNNCIVQAAANRSPASLYSVCVCVCVCVIPSKTPTHHGERNAHHARRCDKHTVIHASTQAWGGGLCVRLSVCVRVCVCVCVWFAAQARIEQKKKWMLQHRGKPSARTRERAERPQVKVWHFLKVQMAPKCEKKKKKKKKKREGG